MIRAIFAAYKVISPERTLLREFQAFASPAQFLEIMGWLGPVVSLSERIMFASRASETLIIDEIDHASDEERRIAAEDGELISYLRSNLSPGRLFRVRKRLIPAMTPDQLYEPLTTA